MSTPSITVAVDPTNPGQFFACCGLLELADRLWPGTEGWFGEGGREFHVTCDDSKGSLRELLEVLTQQIPKAIERLEINGLEVAPIIAPLAFSFDGEDSKGFTLDAWTQIRAEKGEAKVISNPPWNFWSGQQTSLRIWTALRSELISQMVHWNWDDTKDVFNRRLFQKGRFGFDPGPAWNALDVGFSPNEQGIEVESSAVVELLAAIGIQRFRPLMNDRKDGFDYYTWNRAYSPSIAAAAMAGQLKVRQSLRFRTSVISRGQYAALSISFPLSFGESDE